VLIPSIDLMGGKIVQLVQGEKKALEFDDFEAWMDRFAQFPIVQLIDLDAAIGTGNNRALLKQFTGRLRCQVGGGIRSLGDAAAVLASGAARIIVGSILVKSSAVDIDTAQQFADELGSEQLTFAVDSKNGNVAIKGWREITAIGTSEMMQDLEPYCSAFLYTNIDTEGLLQGFPVDVAKRLRALTSRQLIVAGGIRSQREVDELDALEVDAVVGMAIYTGQMSLKASRK